MSTKNFDCHLCKHRNISKLCDHCALERQCNDLERQLEEAREFIEIVGKYGDCSNPLMAISRIMKHYDKLKEQGE